MADKYHLIDLEDAMGKYSTSTHASHVLLWTKDNRLDKEVIYGLVQMRSDGRFGFPGGHSDEKTVDEKEIVAALCRELMEEINFNPPIGQFTIKDRVCSHLVEERKVLHFFVKELPYSVFEWIEKNHMFARDFIKESLGLIRIPLKATGQSTYAPTRKFFKNFGKHHFAGNARNQLIYSVTQMNLIGESDVNFFTKKMSQ